MDLCILISMALVALYIALVYRRRGSLPDSMGTEVYVIPDGGWRWLWSVWMWSTVYTITPKLFHVIPEQGQPCAHAFATAMLLLGILPLLKHEGDRGVFALGLAACFMSQVCVALVCPWWLLMWLSLPALAAWRSDLLAGGRYRLFVELTCYCSLTGSLLFN